MSLRDMRDDEFSRWLPTMRAAYAEEMVVNGGVSEEQAHAKAVNDVAQLFPGEEPSAGQSVFVIEDDGQRVGELWLAERTAILGPTLWIYDLHVDEKHRGRGYGKTAMRYAEDEARRRGLSEVSLMVFGGNEVARGLYRSLGYGEDAVYMSKRV